MKGAGPCDISAEAATDGDAGNLKTDDGTPVRLIMIERKAIEGRIRHSSNQHWKSYLREVLGNSQ